MYLGLVGLLSIWMIFSQLAGGIGQTAGRLPENRLVVSPEGPYQTIHEALQAAAVGDTIEVRGGVYDGPLVVDKPVTLTGINWPVIDGHETGTVVTLSAEGIVFEGFEVRGSGNSPDRDHSGIVLEAPNITVERNRLSDVLFGIFVAQAHGSLIRENNITSKEQYDLPRKGDGIRVWYSHNTRVENNDVHAARDVVIWYSNNVLVQGNRIQDGRYGIHLMYCDGVQILNNEIQNNSVGIYTMYSEGVKLTQNDIRGQRGPSGYALGFKDTDNLEVKENLLVDNRAGIFIDNTPFKINGKAYIIENIIAYNDIGIILLTAERGATFSDNTFWENEEQVAIQGGGSTGENYWQSNFWSDYSGYDANFDGQGDLPYNADRFYERLVDREPLLRALAYSPVVQAIEMAATTFPIVKPKPKFSDPTPRIKPADLPALVSWTGGGAVNPSLVLTGIAMLSVTLAGLLLVRKEQY